MAAGLNTSRAMFSMGKHTLAVPMELFALNRRRLRDRLRQLAPRAVVLLQGGSDMDIYDTDCAHVFQQIHGAPLTIAKISPAD